MAKKADIGAKIGIEGEKEFREQIKQINIGLNTLSTESKLVKSQFIGQEESTAALTKKTDVLQRELYSLNEKLSVQERYLKASADAYGVADEKTQKLQQAVNNTRTEINETTAKIAKNTEAIADNAKAEQNNTAQAGAASAAMGKLNGALSGVAQSLGLSREQTDALSSAFNGGGNLSLAVAGAAAAAGITLIVKAVKAVSEAMKEAVIESTKFADDISTLSQQTGLSTDFLQGLDYASEIIDVSTEDIARSLKTLKKNLFSESKDVRAAFEELKLDPDWFIYSDTPIEDVFFTVINALSQIENEYKKDHLAQLLFGKGYQELAGIIDDGGQKFRELLKYSEEHYNLTQDQIEALHELDDSFYELNYAMISAKRQIAAELAPELTELTKQILEVAQTVDWPAFGRAVSDMITNVAPLIVDLANSIAAAANALASLMDNVSAFKQSDLGKNIKTFVDSSAGTGIKFAAYNMLPEGVRGAISTARTISGLLTSGSSNQSAQAQQPIVVQSSITLDGQTLGRAVTPVVNTRNTQRGRTF